jgi:DNA ligase-1
MGRCRRAGLSVSHDTIARMLLARLVETSAALVATSSRNAKIALVADALRAAGSGLARADAEGADDATSVEARPVEAGSEARCGEAGLVAAYLSNVVPQRRLGIGWRGAADLPEPAADASLTLTDVDEAFEEMARAAGPGSTTARRAAFDALMGRATAAEQDYLRGLILGGVRQGAQDGVMLAAIAQAAGVPLAAVQRAVMLAGFAGPVAQAALAGGEAALAAVRLEVGRPLRPMLAGSAPDVAAVVTGEEEVILERKIDGIRIQAHKSGGVVRLFTRSLDEITERLPEVVDVVAALPAEDIVLDGETVAVRPDGRPEPFQVTGSRTASSTDPAQLRVTTPLATSFFDLLHLDGVDLLDLPLADRIARLDALLPPDARIPRERLSDAREAAAFFAAQVAAGHEGVIVKDPRSPYAAGRRGAGWVKVKPRHTLDLVVLAVEWGSGRRRGLLSNIHLGARDPRTDEFVMLGKTFKGMTDAMLTWQTERFQELEVRRDAYTVHVRPEQVVEIAFDAIQRSSRYPGGMALRFARVLRYRDDKSAAQADTLDTVVALRGW